MREVEDERSVDNESKRHSSLCFNEDTYLDRMKEKMCKSMSLVHETDALMLY